MQTNNSDKRNIEIDILKGIAILLMVIGHSGADSKVVNFIYLFHMAIFFMATGFFFKETAVLNTKDLVRYTIKKAKSLYVIWCIWSIIFILLNNVFIKINVYADAAILADYTGELAINAHSYMGFKQVIIAIIKVLCFAGGTEMGGAFWFFKVLFLVSVLYAFVNMILMKITHNKIVYNFLQGGVSTLLLFISWIMKHKGITFWAIDVVCAVYSLFFIGKLFAEAERLSDCLALSKKGIKEHIVIVASTFVILLVANMFGSISIVDNTWENPLFLIICSLAGRYMIYSLSCVLSKLASMRLLTNVLVYFG